MSAEIVQSLINRSYNEISRCKNDIFEATIKFVDISDRVENTKRMIIIQENSLYKSNKIIEKLKALLIHLSNERNIARQDIINLKFKLQKVKQKLKDEKKMLEE